MSAVDAALKSSAAVLYLRSVQKWNNAEKVNSDRLRSTASMAGFRAGSSGSTPKTQTTVSPVPASLDSVLACIRNHESGNYTESSHPNSGSGAYQYVPGTWRTWSARAGYPGYAYAYLAPPTVQDAVTEYALTHGGAGNWSERYGPDPCTAGLPGGG